MAKLMLAKANEPRVSTNKILFEQDTNNIPGKDGSLMQDNLDPDMDTHRNGPAAAA